MSISENSLEAEARLLSFYIVNKPPSSRAIRLYVAAVKGTFLTDTERKLINFAFSNRRLIGALDGALAIQDPDSELRRRIYLMFAILEASPELHDKFLPKDRSIFYFALVIGTGCRAIARTALGFIIIKVKGLIS